MKVIKPTIPKLKAKCRHKMITIQIGAAIIHEINNKKMVGTFPICDGCKKCGGHTNHRREIKTLYFSN
jgi:hypothetical protein